MEIKRLIVGMVQTNCYIAVHPETKEAVIVDPGDEAARIEDALAQTGAKAKAILLTHGHFDHVTAMEELRRDLGVPVYACEQEQAVLADPDKNLSVQFHLTVWTISHDQPFCTNAFLLIIAKLSQGVVPQRSIEEPHRRFSYLITR